MPLLYLRCLITNKCVRDNHMRYITIALCLKVIEDENGMLWIYKDTDAFQKQLPATASANFGLGFSILSPFNNNEYTLLCRLLEALTIFLALSPAISGVDDDTRICICATLVAIKTTAAIIINSVVVLSILIYPFYRQSDLYLGAVECKYSYLY